MLAARPEKLPQGDPDQVWSLKCSKSGQTVVEQLLWEPRFDQVRPTLVDVGQMLV